MPAPTNSETWAAKLGDAANVPPAVATYQIVIPPVAAGRGGLRFSSQSPEGKAKGLSGLALGSERVGNAIGLRDSAHAGASRWAIVLDVERFADGHVRLTFREE